MNKEIKALDMSKVLLVGKDGNQYFCVKGDFVNLHESNAVFADTPEGAVNAFIQNEKLWRTHDEWLEYMGLESEALCTRKKLGEEALSVLRNMDYSVYIEFQGVYADDIQPPYNHFKAETETRHENAISVLKQVMSDTSRSPVQPVNYAKCRELSQYILSQWDATKEA